MVSPAWHPPGRAAVAALLPGLIALLTAAPPRARAADEIHWTITGPTSVTLDWRGASAGLRFGPTSAYGMAVTGVAPSPLPVSSAGPFWEAKLAGLAPDAIYHYSIAGGPDHLFRTPPATSADNFTVLAEADVGDSATYARVDPVQALVAAAHPAFVLVIGDLTYADAHGQAAVDTHYDNVMAWSEDAAYMPAWGNHEWEDAGDDLRNYKGRFDLPHAQSSPGAPALGGPGKDWSWFDYGNVRFIGYPEPYPGAWADWAPRAGALMDEAQTDPAIRFVVTFGHRPAYSSGYHPGEPELAAILDSLGDTHAKYVLNLNGHSHNYERSYPLHGVTHVTVGTGGSTLEQVTGPCPYLGGCPPPAWSAFRAYHHGALRLDFTQTSITGHALCGPAGDAADNLDDITCDEGAPFDSFTVGVDHPPVLAAPDSALAAPGVPLAVVVHASDPDGDHVRSLSADFSRLPPGAGATFEPAPGDTAGVVRWTPAPADTGRFAVTIRAANALVAQAVITVQVVDTAGFAPPDGRARLAIEGVSPNPAAGEFSVRYDLADGDPAWLELLDPRGRVVLRRELTETGPGPHVARFAHAARPASGVYWLRLTQDRRSVSARVALLR